MENVNIIEKATFVIFDFLNSNKNIDEFCKDRNINRKDFQQFLLILRETRPNLYKEYERKIDVIEDSYIKSLENTITNIIDNICNGLKQDDGSIKKYQYLDYCLETNLSFETFYKYAEKLGLINLNNRQLIKNFISRNTNNKPLKTNEVLKTSYNVLLNGNQYRVSELEKLQALEYMRDLNLPQEVKIYKQVIKRYLDGNLNYYSSKKHK